MPRTSRYAVLGDPGTASEFWFVLHGYGQLAARFVRRFAGLPGVASGRRAVVAPEALSRFYVERERGGHGPSSRVGATWMTREDRAHEIADYVEYLDRVAEALDAGAAERVTVLGFSQGAETASRWVCYGQVRPAEVVLWGGGLAEDLEPEAAVAALGGARPVFVVGDADEWGGRRSADSLARLAVWGVEAERVPFAGGHDVDAAVLASRWPV